MSRRGGMKNDPRRIEIGNTFSERLKEKMADDKVTATALAKSLGENWNPANIDAYINKEKEPAFATAARIAEKLEVSCDYLAGFTNNTSQKAEKAHAADALGLSSLSEKAIGRLASILALQGHWRRDVLPYIQAQDRWNIEGTREEIEDDVYYSMFGSSRLRPIRNYELYRLTSCLLVDGVLSDDLCYSLLKNVLITSLEYIELKDAYAYTEQLRKKEKEKIDSKSVLLGLQKNEYDNVVGMERTSFDKLGHDKQLKHLKERQTIQRAIIHDKIDEILDTFFENRIKSIPKYGEKADAVVSDVITWLENVMEHDAEFNAKISELSAENAFAEPTQEEFDDQIYYGDYAETDRAFEEEEKKIASRLSELREGKIDG